jgi:signal transduction histidine kinase
LRLPKLIPVRQSLLFLGAVVAPSAVLIILGIRTVHQDEELAARQAAEESRNTVALAQRELLTRLETVKLRAAAGQVSPRDSEAALVAGVESGRLILPWEHTWTDSKAVKKAREDLGTAAKLVREGNRSKALVIATRLAELPSELTDEYGIPYAIYGARSLAEAESSGDQRESSQHIQQILKTTWLSPPALYMIAGLPNLGQDLREEARARAVELEQTGTLIAEIPVLESDGGRGDDNPLWLLAGDAPWLVSLAGRPADRNRVLIIVRARQILDVIHLPGRSHWVLGREPGSEPLGESFPGVRIAVDPFSKANVASMRWFYLATAILLSVASFSAWLLNRDIRREARLARLRSQFVSSVSHELKTPIAAIRAYAELIDMGRAQGPREMSEYLKIIMGESERLSRLVEGVLEFSKLEQGKRLYRFDPISLEEVVRSAAHALEYSLGSGEFQLHFDLDPSLPRVSADRDALEQAVVNLLSNAMKYSGGNREIDLTLRREGDRAVIRVRDRGIGIAPEDHSRIFESFYRAPLIDGRLVPGTGLGLTLVDHIVKAHRGRVLVESQIGEGSTFSILLPIPEGI